MKTEGLGIWCDASRQLIRIWGPDVLVLEGQVVFSSSAKSMASATRGDLFLLAHQVGAMIGAYYAWCELEHREPRFEIVQPVAWKGQLTKGATATRLEEWLPAKWKGIMNGMSEHEVDALGLALWWIRKEEDDGQGS